MEFEKVSQYGKPSLLLTIDIDDKTMKAAKASAVSSNAADDGTRKQSINLIEQNEGKDCFLVSYNAIASRMELLGCSSAEEALREILYIHEHGEPEPDPETGENAWTSAYEELRSILRASGIKDNNTLIRSMSMSQMSSDGLSGIALTRSRLGLWDKSSPDVSLMSVMDYDDEYFNLPQELLDLIEADRGEIEKCRKDFLDSLTPNDGDDR